MACALLGAGDVFGFDVDPNAGPAARSLAERNGVADRCRFEVGGFELLGGRAPHEGLVANLYADLLQEEARRLARSLAPGGWFLCSGIARRHLPGTLHAFGEAGLRVGREARSGGLVHRRRPA